MFLFRFIEHLVEHICRFATKPVQAIQAESDYNLQTSQSTSVVADLKAVREDALETSVRLAEEQDGRENVE